MRSLATLCTLATTMLLAGCGTVAVASRPDVPPQPAFDAVAAVTAIRAAGKASASELDVQPLRDPQVEDLRQQASELQAKGMFRAAADLLDQALAINADDPAMLQERAEAALLLQQLPDAEGLAQRAFAAGSQVGPLCRRHWETIAQVRDGLAVSPSPPEASASAARRQRDACTVAAPDRF